MSDSLIESVSDSLIESVQWLSVQSLDDWIDLIRQWLGKLVSESQSLPWVSVNQYHTHGMVMTQ